MLLGAAAPLSVVQPHVDAALCGVVRLLLVPSYLPARRHRRTFWSLVATMAVPAGVRAARWGRAHQPADDQPHGCATPTCCTPSSCSAPGGPPRQEL